MKLIVNLVFVFVGLCGEFLCNLAWPVIGLKPGCLILILPLTKVNGKVSKVNGKVNGKIGKG